MPSLAAIDGGTYYHHRTVYEPPFAPFFDAAVHVRDMADADLDAHDIVFLPCRLNADLIAPQGGRLIRFMEDGGTLVAMGETFPERWLPGITATPVETNFWWWLEPGASLGVRLTGACGMEDYLDEAALSWHLHGYFTLRTGQVPLIEADGRCLMFMQDWGKGRLIATTLDPCYHHGSYFMPATTRFLHGFLPWLKRQGTQAPRTGEPA